LDRDTRGVGREAEALDERFVARGEHDGAERRSRVFGIPAWGIPSFFFEFRTNFCCQPN